MHATDGAGPVPAQEARHAAHAAPRTAAEGDHDGPEAVRIDPDEGPRATTVLDRIDATPVPGVSLLRESIVTVLRLFDDPL